jgi:hypothetical protein
MAELFRAALVKNFFAACNESAQESYVIAKKKSPDWYLGKVQSGLLG